MNLNKEKNFMSFVIYADKKLDKTIDFITNLNNYVKEHFLHYEFVVVNDSYYTKEELNTLKKMPLDETTVLNVINMSFHQGIEKSMIAGMDLAIGDFVYEFDTVNVDYKIEEVLNVYNLCLTGIDIVSTGNGKNRSLSSKMYYSLFNHYSNTNNPIATTSFFLLSRRAINRIKDISDTMPYRKAIFANCGLRYMSYSYTPTKRIKDRDASKQDKKHLVTETFIIHTKLFFKIGFIFTLFMALISLFFVGYTVYIYISSTPTEGWTTTMLLLSIGFTALFAFLCIILCYLKTIVTLQFEKKSYFIEGIEKGNSQI